MKPVSGKRFCRILETRGWELARIQGSHRIYRKAGHIERITVPVHGKQELKRGLQSALMKLAGLRDEDFQ
jgi:predicted RNA binding protein YcfA (HicA-like mRNA interferase family)